MARVPVQVPEEMKTELESLREKFRVKTLYETIGRLMVEQKRAEKEREEARSAAQRERERVIAEDVRLGEDLKGRLSSVANDLGLSETLTIEFLLTHYERSDSIDKYTFHLYRGLRG